MDTAENHPDMEELDKTAGNASWMVLGEKRKQTSGSGEKQQQMVETEEQQQQMAELGEQQMAETREKQQQMAEPESTRRQALDTLLQEPTEEHLWDCIVAFQGEPLLTMSGLPYIYTLKQGKRGGYTRELWVDRRENSKSITWSSVKMAFQNLLKMKEALPEGEIPYVKRPKALGDIRGISYIYPLFFKFGLIEIHAEKEDRPNGDMGSTKKNTSDNIMGEA